MNNNQTASGLTVALHGMRHRWRVLLSTLRGGLFATPLYGLYLRGATPDTLRLIPPDPWPGNSQLGNHILARRIPIVVAGTVCGEFPLDDDPWQVVEGETLSTTALETLHGFTWLRHLRAINTPHARSLAISLIETWVHSHPRWSPLPWRPDVLGNRLAAWLTCFSFIADGDTASVPPAVLKSMAEQARHLARVSATQPSANGQFSALTGWLFAALSGLLGGDALNRCLRHLDAALTAQISADGGHQQRNPAIHLEVMAQLISMRDALKSANCQVPTALVEAIDRMAPLLRTYRHGDGALALFNGGIEGDPSFIDQVLALSAPRGKALTNAPHVGFSRVRAGRMVLLVDSGTPRIADDGLRGGLLSFELSVGRQRFITNCGAFPDRSSDWHDALRQAAAQSTLTVNEDNAIPLESAGSGARHGAMPQVSLSRTQAEGSTLLTLRHDGYRTRYGVTHHRELFVAADGNDLRGRDLLEGRGKSTYAVRFHLHPAIKATLVRDGAEALLRVPGAGGWRFRCHGGALALRESIYVGDGRRPRRCQQLILSGPLDNAGVEVKWGLRREAQRASSAGTETPGTYQ